MTWVSNPTLQELTSTYQHYHFLLRVLRAVSPYDGIPIVEVVIETQGDYAPWSVYIGCGLLFGPECWDDRVEVTVSNIDLLEQTRREVIAFGCFYDYGELFCCRERKRLPHDGIERYGETKALFQAIEVK